MRKQKTADDLCALGAVVRHPDREGLYAVVAVTLSGVYALALTGAARSVQDVPERFRPARGTGLQWGAAKEAARAMARAHTVAAAAQFRRESQTRGVRSATPALPSNESAPPESARGLSMLVLSKLLHTGRLSPIAARPTRAAAKKRERT